MYKDPLLILLADDDEGDRMIFLEALSEIDFKTVVQTVVNGAQLMEMIKLKDAHLPDIIFLDLNLPRKNGMDCLKEIRTTASLKNIFIAIYSTSANQHDIEVRTNSGANVYITKPNSFSKLKEILETTLSQAVQFKCDPFRKV